jgi:hypothetical protein
MHKIDGTMSNDLDLEQTTLEWCIVPVRSKLSQLMTTVWVQCLAPVRLHDIITRDSLHSCVDACLTGL